MVDVPQARVRVSPSRLKKLKKIIADCDREIQVLNAEMVRCKSVLGIAEHLGVAGKAHYTQWRKLAEKTLKQRQKLDAKRRQARLEAKGYR